MKKLTLVFFGLIPLALGFVMNSWLMNHQESILPFKLIGLVFLIFWAVVGYLTSTLEKTPFRSAVIAHLPALIMAIYLLLSLVVTQKLGENYFSSVAQFFFLPLVGISQFVIGWLLTLLGMGISFWVIIIISVLLMFGSYSLGSYLKTGERYRISTL